MAYLPELHYCCRCGCYLGPDNGDAICGTCESMPMRCSQGHFVGEDGICHVADCQDTWGGDR